MNSFVKWVTLLIILFPFYSDGFVQPPHFATPTVITNLEGILTSKAIASSIISNLRSEVTFERLLLQVTQFNYHSIDYFYISIFITYLYGQYKFLKGSESCQIDTKLEKLEKFDKYQKVSRITREVLFILFILFSKDVQNAI
jgi:hypothetical protein